MEGLRKLEEVQRTILLMQSEGFMSSSSNSSNDPDSDRFLSNFILLLVRITHLSTQLNALSVQFFKYVKMGFCKTCLFKQVDKSLMKNRGISSLSVLVRVG